MKAAIIGLGVGREHARAYVESGCEIVSVVDWDNGLRDAAAEEYGCRSASQFSPPGDGRESLDDADIVSVCSHDQFHFEQIKRLWEAGKHVVVEKPPCLRPDELPRLRELIESRPDQQFMCNLPLPFHPPFARFAETDFGQIYLVEASYNWGRVEKLRQGWRRDCPGYSIVLGAGLHMIHLMLWIKQTPFDNGAALGCNFNVEDFDNHDTVVALWKWRDGSLGRLTVNCGYYGQHGHELRVFGTETMLIDHSKIDLTGNSVVDKTLSIRKFIECVEKGVKWDNTHLWHAMEVCFNIDKSAHE